MLTEHHDLNQIERAETRSAATISTGNTTAEKILGQKCSGKIIEFYIPSSFRKKFKWTPPEQRGMLIPFAPLHVPTSLAR
jgi:hypothetical protein